MNGDSHFALSTWKEQLWNTYVRLESDSDDDGFFGAVREVSPVPHGLTLVSSTHQRTERTSANIRSDPQGHVLVAFQISGEGFAEQSGRLARTEPHDFVLYETTHPYKLSFRGEFRQLVLKLPLSTLEQRLTRFSTLTATTIRGDQGPGAIAREFVQSLARRSPELSTAEYEALVGIAADLIANACLAQRGSMDVDRHLFEAIRSRLRRAARDPHFDSCRFARQERMSLRSLHRLFQLNGTTPGREVLGARLDGAMRDLQSALHADRMICDIAFSWGFTDLSHFNREFRRRFGHPPSIARSARG